MEPRSALDDEAGEGGHTGGVNGRLTAATPLEQYVDARELAELMGVSVRTIKRLVAAGMPSETWGMSRTRRFLPSQAIAWTQSRATMAHRTGAACNAPPDHRQPKK
jgi:hypothetical protein